MRSRPIGTQRLKIALPWLLVFASARRRQTSRPGMLFTEEIDPMITANNDLQTRRGAP